MKLCPKCNHENSDENLICIKCFYEFEKDSSHILIKHENEKDEWPSDEWKDWNLM